MRGELFLRLGALVALAANIFGIIQFGGQNPLVYIPLAIIALVIVVLATGDRFFAYWQIKAVLGRAEQQLRIVGFHPELLVAFDRSSAVFAAMLAQRLGISEVLALPRRAHVSVVPSQPRTIVVGDGLTVNLSGTRLEKTLVVVFHLRTGATLEAGLQTLPGWPDAFPGKILAIHATAGGGARWPAVLIVDRLKPGEVPNEKLPWMSGRYLHS